MTTPQPALESSRILERLNTLSRKDEFVIHGIKRQAEKLRTVDLRGALCVEAAAFALLGNEQGAIDKVRQLLVSYGSEFEPLMNAHYTLYRVFHIGEAADVLARSAVLFPDHTQVSFAAMMSMVLSGRVSEAKRFADTLKALSPESNVQEYIDMSDLFARHAVRDADATAIVTAAEQVYRGFEGGYFIGRSFSHEEHLIHDESGYEAVYVRIILDPLDSADDERVFQLNDTLACALADESFIGNTALGRFSMDFVLRD